MTSFKFRLRGWAGWSPGRVALDGDLPASLRRRIGPAGQHLFRAALGMPDAASSRLIFSSRHGEFGRTLSILESLAEDREVSPADFTLSVHHALAGLLSIAQGNRGGHVALAAGEESFCYGLVEAAACLAADPAEPVLLLHYDELLPGPFADFNAPTDTPAILALALHADEGQGFSAAFLPAEGEGKETAAAAGRFLDFLGDGHPALTYTGQTMQWRWTRDAAA